MNTQLFTLSLLSSFAFFTAQADPIRTQTYEIQQEAAMSEEFPLNQTSTFSIDNASGTVTVLGIEGHHIKIAGSHPGKTPVKIIFTEVKPGKIKIAVEYPSVNPFNTTPPQGSSKSPLGKFLDFFSLANILSKVSGGTVVQISGPGATLEVGIPKDLLGDLKVNSTFGKITVKDFSENENRFVYLNSSSGSIAVENLFASRGLTVESTFANISIDKIQADMILKASSGDITVSNYIGYVFAESTFNTIDITNGQGDLVLTSGHANITSRNGVGDVVARSTFGEVDIQQQKGHISAITGHGDINFDNPESLSEHAETTFGEKDGIRKSVKCSKRLAPYISVRNSNPEAPFNY